jgi:outer membrane protein assembly factor BamB
VHTVAGPAAPTLAVASGRVVASDGSSLAALDARSGVTDWTATPPDDSIVVDPSDPCGGRASAEGASAPVIAGDQVFGLLFGCGRYYFPGASRVDLATGALTDTYFPPPLGSEFGGTILSQTVAPGGTTYITGVVVVQLGPTSYANEAFLSSGNTTIYSALFRSVIGRPAISHARAFLVSEGGLNAVSLPSAGSGSLLWTAGLSSNLGQTPSVDDSRVYVTDGATLRAFDQTTGAPVWTAALPATGSTDAPAVASGKVFVRTANELVAIDAATGALAWTATLGTLGTSATGLGSPTIANGVVYVGSQDGRLLAFDAAGASGCCGSPVVCTPLLSADIGGAPGASRPVPANGSVFIGAHHADGNEAVYKFSLPG